MGLQSKVEQEREGAEWTSLLDAHVDRDVAGVSLLAPDTLGAAGVDFLADLDELCRDLEAPHHQPEEVVGHGSKCVTFC